MGPTGELGGDQEAVEDPALSSKLLADFPAWLCPEQEGYGVAGELSTVKQGQFGVKNIRFQ